MRLRDIENLVETNLPFLKITQEGNTQGGVLCKTKELRQCIAALDNLERYPLFSSSVRDLKKIPGIVTFISSHITANNFELTHSSFNSFNEKIEGIISTATQVKRLLNLLLPPQETDSVSILLPSLQTVGDLSSLAAKLQKVFDQLLSHEKTQGEVKLSGFDTGSMWIELVFVGAALKMFAWVVRTVILIKREEMLNQQLLDSIKARKVQTEMINSLASDLKEQAEMLNREQISQIMRDLDITENGHEYSERLRYCVSAVRELIETGIQVYPSLTSSKETKDDFPDFSKPLEYMLPERKKIDAPKQDTDLK
jgi:hypothetical protein